MPDPGTSVSALELLQSAGRLAGVLASGETFSGAEGADAMSILNQLVDAWNGEDLMIYSIESNTFSFVASQQVYTMGSGGNFNIARPAKIERMTVIDLTNPGTPIEIPITLYTEQEWRYNVPVKNITNIWPYICYDDGNFPFRNLNFFPIPTATNQVIISSWQPLQTYAATNTKITYPPAYYRALRFNLAVELAMEFHSDIPAAVVAEAAKSKAIVKMMNGDPITLRCDDALRPVPMGGGTDPYAIIRGF